MSFNPGDVIIHRAQLTGWGGTGSLDVAQHLRHFSVFESLKKPYVSFQGQIIDMVDMVLDLNGANELQLEFSQPGQDFHYEKTFAITSVQRSHNSHNLRTQELEVVGYSPHMTTFPKVQKAYKNVTATDTVDDLVRTFVQPRIPFEIIAPARSIIGTDRMPYDINGVQIWKAIRQTLLRAASTLDESSAYMIFENNRRLLVDTLVNLQYNARATRETEFYQRPMGQDFLRDHAWQNQTILSLHEETRIDKTMTVQAENMESRPYDVVTNTFEAIQYGLTSGLNAAGISTYMNIPYNILRPPTYLAAVLPERKRAAAAFDQQSLTIHVALNPYVTVGEGFYAETLAPGSSVDTLPPTISGTLLCTEVRHTVDFTKRRMAGTTTAKGVAGDMSIW